jgi:UPF0755 protein
MTRSATFAVGAAVILGATLAACGGGDPDPSVEPEIFTIPSGSTFQGVVDTLQARGLVERPGLFRVYARLKKADTRIRAGEYALRPGTPWSTILDDLVTGRVETVPMTVPEGFILPQIAERIAPISGADPDTVLAWLTRDGADTSLGVPGPGLEGYLFPDTYRFAKGTSVERVVATMVDHYHAVWTPERRARLDSIGMTEQEAATLASIIQGEARMVEEMPTISAVYHNRLDRGWLLQADPTIQYALGGRRERLLYADIDSVADHPYNTYTQPGLPPGPIGAPGDKAFEAALYPADVDFMFFVARPDGSHVFTRTLAEHNRAKAASRRELDRIRREAADPGGP